LNGKRYTKNYLLHSDIIKGGSFECNMTTKVLAYVNNKKDYPSSNIKDELIVSVPYFGGKDFKFQEKQFVTVKHIDDKATIYYRIIQPNIRSVFVKYEKPFEIFEAGVVEAYALVDNNKSKIVGQHFHKILNNYKITVLSKVHPLYTAGGSEALIDGLEGTTNWRAGDWQSYFDQDFEAIIDLQKIKAIEYLGVHVLQDVSPWILYPKEVIFYSSEDGKAFTEIGKVTSSMELKNEPATMKELGIYVEAKTRYIKIKAINGGKLPAWHESAGNPSHLFIDEIIIK
jgi:hypothetical protein